jgi:pentatricopeptide repeat domain-containing protein 1
MLLSESMSPDLITFSTLLKGCCRKGDVEKAKEVVNCMGRMGIQPDESLLQMISDLLNHSKTPRTQQRDQFVE